MTKRTGASRQASGPGPKTAKTTSVHGDKKKSSAERQRVYFPNVPDKIIYKGLESVDPLSFRYYNADEEIMGKKMKDWLRFSVCFW